MSGLFTTLITILSNTNHDTYVARPSRVFFEVPCEVHGGHRASACSFSFIFMFRSCTEALLYSTRVEFVGEKGKKN